MTRSEEIKQLALALCEAQKKMELAKKTSENPFFHSKYADLASVWDAIRIPFTENGFSISQFTETKDNQACVTTLLLHVSGEWLKSELVLPTTRYDKEKNPIPLDPQAFGSALSYARRYALAALCGVATEDDDSEGAMDRDKKLEQEKTKQEKIKDKNKPYIPEKKPKLPTQAHYAAWKLLVDVYNKDAERIKLAIEEITQKQSLLACSEEEAAAIITRLEQLQKDMNMVPDSSTTQETF